MNRQKKYRRRINRIFERRPARRQPFKKLLEWANRPIRKKKKAQRFKALADWAEAQQKHRGKHHSGYDGDHDSDAHKEWRKRKRVWRRRARQLERRADHFEDPGIEDGGWHPDARRVGVVSPSGSFVTSHKRLVWHTTEGYGLPSYSGSNPHFTIDIGSGALYQHQSIEGGARALRNLGGGVETNRQGAIQVEIIGFASQSQDWDGDAYDHLADLARWIEKHGGVPRECGVSFAGNGATPHMSSSRWQSYEGHCGHQHVPENDHWDPGRFDVKQVLDR